MDTIFAGSRTGTQNAMAEALDELQTLTGVTASEWACAADPTAKRRADRLEFLADVMLGIDDDDKAAAARVAELYRQALGEPVHSPALRFRHAHGDPAGWDAADNEAYENLALAQMTGAAVRIFVPTALPNLGEVRAA